MYKKTDKDLESTEAIEALIELEQSGKIDRREFLNLSSLISGGLLFSELFRSQNAFGWIATRMRKGSGSSVSIDVGDIGHSLRLRRSNSSYLGRTFGTAEDSSKWTLSAWVKRGQLSADYMMLFSRSISASANFDIRYNVTNDTLEWVFSNTQRLTSTAVFRDPGAWMHLLFVWDVANATSTERAKIFVNGTELTTFSIDHRSSLSAAQNAWNVAGPHYIGNSNGTSYFFDGYLSRVAFVEGQLLTPNSFGYLNTNSNSWVTKSQALVKAAVDAGGVNSFMLDFDNGSSLANLAKDKSVKVNNWTCNNISLTAGATYDWMLDTPSNNFCVLNPMSNPNTPLYSVTNGNLSYNCGAAANNAGRMTVAGTTLLGAGKTYWEVTPNDLNVAFGVLCYLDQGIAINVPSVGDLSYAIGSRDLIGNQNAGTLVYTGSAFSFVVGDIIGLAFDGTAGSLAFYKNGLYVGTYDGFITSKPWLPGMMVYTGAASTNFAINFGQRPFAYTPPTGFNSLCTANLPTPVVANPKKHFDVIKYAGDGLNNRNLAISYFDPDLMWFKQRTGTAHNMLVDRLRGDDKALISNLTNSESPHTGYLTFGTLGSKQVQISYTGSGGADFGYNQATNNYVSWLWKAGGVGVANNLGTISSQVSANQAAGFSIVTYTGTLSATPSPCPTVGHGLNLAPKLIISKSRTAAGVETGNWFVWHSSAGTNNWLRLNLTSAAADVSSSGGGSMLPPTNSVFSTPYISGSNINANSYVAYCFAEISGYSKIGSYVGNGNADGPFVYCGFRPRYLMLKCSSASGTNWMIIDSARNTNNVANLIISNTTDILSLMEQVDANRQVDLLSNGFKIRHYSGGHGDCNINGYTYIFIAFAEAPSKYANAR